MAARFNRPDLKSKLVDAAWELFTILGYDGTTIEVIIDRVGVSKGAFYHYFSDKQEILDAVMERMISAGLEDLKLITEDSELSALAKLNRYLASSRSWRLSSMETVLEVARVMYRDENVIIRHKMHRRVVAAAQPLLAAIISQGVREGVFRSDDSDETAFFLLNVLNVIGEIQTRSLLDLRLEPGSVTRLERRADLYIGFLEKLLGMPKGSIERIEHGIFERIAESIRPHGVPGKGESHGTD